MDTLGFSQRCSVPEECRLTQRLLEQKLGAEHLASRPGPNGAKLTYLEGWKAVELANSVFGFNGWNCSIVDLTSDYIEEGNGKVRVGVTAIVKVSLADGSFHEDVGYGEAESKYKGTAIENAKKGAVTDARKRALRQFGNYLGNCVYDSEHRKTVKPAKTSTGDMSYDGLRADIAITADAKVGQKRPIEALAPPNNNPAAYYENSKQPKTANHFNPPLPPINELKSSGTARPNLATGKPPSTAPQANSASTAQLSPTRVANTNSKYGNYPPAASKQIPQQQQPQYHQSNYSSGQPQVKSDMSGNFFPSPQGPLPQPQHQSPPSANSQLPVRYNISGGASCSSTSSAQPVWHSSTNSIPEQNISPSQPVYDNPYGIEDSYYDEQLLQQLENFQTQQAKPLISTQPQQLFYSQNHSPSPDKKNSPPEKVKSASVNCKT